MQTKANGTNGTNGTNGHGVNERINALLAQLAAEMNAPKQAQQAPAEPVKQKRKPRTLKPAAPEPPKRGEYPEHDHVSAVILEVKVAKASETKSGVDGAGMWVKVRCHCGVEGWLDFPASELEALCMTAQWADDEG
jgi:hypothetical protein